MNADRNPSADELHRRDFLKIAGTAVAATAVAPNLISPQAVGAARDANVIGFEGPDSLFHGHGWETLNPGYWQVKNGALRRRLSNYGDRARSTGFPFHYETHKRNGGKMDVDYDPSLPEGIIYRKDWKLTGEYSVTATFTFHGRDEQKREGDSDEWKMFNDGHGLMGIGIGAKNLFESYGKVRNTIIAAWTDDGKFGLQVRRQGKRNQAGKQAKVAAPRLKAGDRVEISVAVKPVGKGQSEISSTLLTPQGKRIVATRRVASKMTQGYFGIAGRGLADFEVNQVGVTPGKNEPLLAGEVDCHTCYPLGDTLKQTNGKWQVRFVGIFASDGRRAEIRVSESENPAGGWEKVPVAGRAKIVNNEWRRNTSTIHVTLPASPAEKTLYYTVWKDGKNVTSDPRVGSAGTGAGTGFVGDVPASGGYVGRLPQLQAPYKMCGLSCHAVTSGLQQRTEAGLKILGGGDDWMFRDQPTVEAYKHLADYDFQIMCWEDDIWYLELVLYPPSTDDAYKVITASIAGPTSRWQMMRHWNILNPGDHDYGMDDVKGPEQIVIRIKDGLGQDKNYMRRNFQIVQHLISGDEEVDPEANPKKWRSWKMPNRDFTFAILDSRLWRSSQDTAMWDDEGWGHMRDLYDRADPTRSLLGEEQFAWLQELVRTDSSRLICLTGINGMHTVWTGGNKYSNTDEPFAQRDRVAADYAGWVAAGSDRVIELLGSRDGIVTVYGDVHNGCIMKNTDHGLIECSFGPIGRSGGRAVIPGFGGKMKDFDGRPLEVTALYHKTHADPALTPQAPGAPFYWNFLEMEFDPRAADPAIGLRLRNMIDAPDAAPRGGAPLETAASATGRKASSQVEPVKLLPNSDVRIVHTDGRPIRGTRSGEDARTPTVALTDIDPGSQVIVTAFDGRKSMSRVVTTSSVQG
ncbi:MAG: alkaline phosphatase D family protein [Verrucomicrobiia bacterium]|jgi:hypothetical protein